MTQHPITPETMEKAAQALATALNGGDWWVGYTDVQKNVWRERVARAMGQSAADTLRVNPEALVTFLYRNHRGERALRRAWPITIMFGISHWHPEPQWLMGGLDADKNEVRHYALKDCVFDMPAWHMCVDEDDVPAEAGSYMVLMAGDSEHVDGHLLYEFPDFAEWAYWTPAAPEELEDFEGGYRGRWANTMSDPDCIVGWCGPLHVPPIPAR